MKVRGTYRCTFCKQGLSSRTRADAVGGRAGLTRAVQTAGAKVMWVADLIKCEGEHIKEFDILGRRQIVALRNAVRKGKVRWLHGAPPCKTFSKARRTDRHGRARVYRTGAQPQGTWPR